MLMFRFPMKKFQFVIKVHFVTLVPVEASGFITPPHHHPHGATTLTCEHLGV